MSKIKNKNTGPFLTFDEKWFRKHQRILIQLLNAPIIKIWFRWILRIRKCDCTLSEKINLILPNQFHKNARIEGDKIFATADFRTHWKFSKRIYHAFKWVWWALHFWDWLVADRYLPKLNFGFFTLSISPDPLNGLVTCDGQIRRIVPGDVPFITLQDIAENQAINTQQWILSTNEQNLYLEAAYYTSGTGYSFTKSYLFFDTSLLSNQGNVVNAKLGLYANEYVGPINMGQGVVEIYSAINTSLNNNIATNDYFLIGLVLFASTNIDLEQYWIDYYGLWAYRLISQRYYYLQLNNDGLNNINKTGVSKFSARFNYTSVHFGGVVMVQTVFSIASVDTTASNKDPKLVVEYSIPSTNKIQMII